MSLKIVGSKNSVKREALPPSSNTGGKFNGSATRRSADVDYLSFSFPGCDLDASDWVHAVSVMLRSWCGSERVKLEPRKSGLYGYKSSWLVQLVTMKEVVQLGVCAYGGNGGSFYVSLSGTACGLITDWLRVVQSLEHVQAKLTRVDLAVDYLNGEVTFEQACKAYKEGGFTSLGRTPSHRVMGDLLSDVSTDGRTLYVGARGNGKMMRAYEKGKQLGQPTSRWMRVEVEFRAVDQVLPLAMLVERDQHFAGAYPWCAEVLAVARPSPISRTKEKSKVHLANLMKYARQAYGRLLNFLLEAGASADDVVESLRENGVPARLMETVATVKARYGRWSLEDWGAELETAPAPF